MQKTRQKIVEYLKKHGHATVDELSEALNNLTAVTVRHHLDVLRGEGLVGQPKVQHRDTPGRPKYVYALTEEAERLFPKNISTLTRSLMEEMKSSLGPEQYNLIFEGAAQRMAEELPSGPADESMAERLERVVEHLTDHGYEAEVQTREDGYVLLTRNCPYSTVVDEHDDLCKLDVRYISRLVGAEPHRLTNINEGEPTCSYLIPHSALAKT